MPRIGKYWLSLSLYYNTDHVWAKVEPDGLVGVGLDDWGQDAAGKIAYMSIGRVGSEVRQGGTLASIETAKWTGRLKSPVSGTIREANPALKTKPSIVNEDPYGRGWVALIEPSNLEEELKNLFHGDVAVEWLKKKAEKKG